MTLTTVIGVFNSDIIEFVTIGALKKKIKKHEVPFKAKEYCDFIYSTNLIHFNYDPFNGEKIDWNEVRKML